MSTSRALFWSSVLIVTVALSSRLAAPQNTPLSEPEFPPRELGAAILPPSLKTEGARVSFAPQQSQTDTMLPRAEERRGMPRRRVSVPDIIMDARGVYAVTERGDVLFSQNSDDVLQIASITKLMTALVALERAKPDARVIISSEAIAVDGDSAALQVGETLSLHDALLAMLLPSSNDAAKAIADALGGEGPFVDAINAKAMDLHMSTARFFNPHGLVPPGNVASAKDVVTLLRAALSQPLLADMLRQEEAVISGRKLRTTNVLLQRLPGIVGGKTGFTIESQGTLVFAFSPVALNERRAAAAGDPVVYVALLGSRDRFADAEALARWIAGAYEW